MPSETLHIIAAEEGQENIQAIVRQNFRVPIEQIQILIQNKKYNLTDISRNGLGIQLTEQSNFKVHQEVSIQLEIKEEQILIQGKIMHITPAEKYFLCGIKFIQISDNEKIAWKEYIESIKEKILLKKNNEEEHSNAR